MEGGFLQTPGKKILRNNTTKNQTHYNLHIGLMYDIYLRINIYVEHIQKCVHFVNEHMACTLVSSNPSFPTSGSSIGVKFDVSSSLFSSGTTGATAAKKLRKIT